MRFLIHSTSGDGAGIAWKLAQEGHDVSIYLKDESSRKVLDGMVHHVKSVDEGLEKSPECVIFDMSGEGEAADRLKKKGFNVMGAGKVNDLLELNRTFGMDIAEKIGVMVPPREEFSSVADALAHIKETKGRYVLKPHNNISLELTYVSKGPEDMMEELTRVSEAGLLKGPFLLQEFIEGLEISTELWFSRGRPVYPGNGTFEQKKFLAGDLGPNTGSESSVVWIYKDENSPIMERTVNRLIPIMKKFDYTGPIDINAIISEEDGMPYFLEFTPRFGYSAIYGMAELLDQGLGDMLYKVGNGTLKEIRYKPDAMSLAVTLSVHPYPLDSGKPHNRKAIELSGDKAINIEKESFPGFWPYDVRMDKGKYLTAGTLGLVGFVTAAGGTAEDVEENAFDRVKGIKIPDMQYRVDAASRAKEDLPRLAALDYEVPACATADV